MRLSKDATDRLIYLYYLSLDCPRSLTSWILFKNKEFKQLVELEFNPSDYNDLNTARDSLAATKYLSKAIFLDTKIDKKEVAMGKFFDAEEFCKQTNARLKDQSDDVIFDRIISVAAVKISNVLGEFPVDQFLATSGWGPGASTLIKKRDATATNKFRQDGGITRTCYEFVSTWWHQAFPIWKVPFDIQSTNKVVTVPKNAKTDRIIAIEPGINLYLQKGVGSVIRSRLLRSGVDLNTQEHNQKKARLGSKFSNLVTVDFSSASDTISRGIIRRLLPSRWYTILDILRSPGGRTDNALLTYEKFSSMGNGFTFELESLIFYALAYACCKVLNLQPDVTVYGDDVILPNDAYPLYNSVSQYCGFTINLSKSWSSSYYRESCGKHYWNGVDISPIFLKERLRNERCVFKAANSIRRSAHRRNSYGCDRRLRLPWHYLYTLVSGLLKLRIPEGYGDGGLIVNFDECSPSKARHGYEGFFTSHLCHHSLTRTSDDNALLLARLSSLERVLAGDQTSHLQPNGFTSFGNEDVLPGPSRYRVKRLYVNYWYDLGPWI